MKGEAPRAVELKYTRHGPVVFEDIHHHKAYAVRAAWRETGGAPYLASLRMDQSHNWQEFEEACRYSRIPAENMVWADREGNIGYQAVAIAPRRPNWSGLVPVPGDGRYEWDGYLPIKELPHVLNPEKGFYNTSNDYQIPLGWPHRDALHYVWADPTGGNGWRSFWDRDGSLPLPTWCSCRTAIFRFQHGVWFHFCAGSRCRMRLRNRRLRGCSIGIMCWIRIRLRPGFMRCGSGG